MSNVSETAPQTMHTALGLLDVSALAGLDTYCGVVFVSGIETGDTRGGI